MDWTVFIQVLLQESLPVAVQIEQWIEQWIENKTKPTAEEWAALLALGKQTARQRMLLALAQNGIDPASAQGQALLALTPP